VPAVDCVLDSFGILKEAAAGAAALSPASGVLPACAGCTVEGSADVSAATAVKGGNFAISSGIGASMMFCMCMILIGSRALPLETVAALVWSPLPRSADLALLRPLSALGLASCLSLLFDRRFRDLLQSRDLPVRPAE
jgi:hypothetical protein